MNERFDGEIKQIYYVMKEYLRKACPELNNIIKAQMKLPGMTREAATVAATPEAESRGVEKLTLAPFLRDPKAAPVDR